MRRFWSMAIGATALAGLACLNAGCAKDDVEEARKRMSSQSGSQAPGAGQETGGDVAHGGSTTPGGSAGGMPPGHPPMGGPGGMGGAGGSAHGPLMGSSGPTDGNAIPLKLTGLGSAAELERELAKLTDKQAAAHFEQAFRLTFCADASKRDYAGAASLLEPLLATQPRFAPAFRTRGYARFNLNPAQPGESIADYEKAVELDPKYGEAYYAIAFMCAATGDRDKGIDAYRKSMALGVADERHIGENFYADLLQKK